jgi:hypothetical protein
MNVLDAALGGDPKKALDAAAEQVAKEFGLSQSDVADLVDQFQGRTSANVLKFQRAQQQTTAAFHAALRDRAASLRQGGDLLEK